MVTTWPPVARPKCGCARSADRHRSVKGASGDRRAHSRSKEVWEPRYGACQAHRAFPDLLTVILFLSFDPRPISISEVVTTGQLGNSGLHRHRCGDHDGASPRMSFADEGVRCIQISMQIVPKYICNMSFYLTTRIASRLIVNRLYFKRYFILMFNYYYEDTEKICKVIWDSIQFSANKHDCRLTEENTYERGKDNNCTIDLSRFTIIILVYIL